MSAFTRRTEAFARVRDRGNACTNGGFFAARKLQDPLDADAAAYLTRCATAAGAPLAWLHQNAVNRLVIAAKKTGWWSKVAVLHLSASSAQAVALLNVKGSTFAGVAANANGVPTFAPGYGFTSAGNNAVSSGFRLGVDAGSQNDSHLGVYTLTSANMTAGANATRLSMAGKQLGGRLHSAATFSGPSNGTYDTSGHVLFNRASAAKVDLWFNGDKVTSIASASAAPANEVISYAGNAQIGQYGTAQVAIFHAGAALTDEQARAMREDLLAYLRAVGAVLNAQAINPPICAIADSSAGGHSLWTLQTPSRPENYQRSGNHHRFELSDVDFVTSIDPASDRHRVEICQAVAANLVPHQTDLWMYYAVMLEENGPDDMFFMLLGQIHEKDTYNVSPSVALQVVQGHSDFLSLQSSYLPAGGAAVYPAPILANGGRFPRGRVQHVLWKFNVDAAAGTTAGKICLWLNGVQVVNALNHRNGAEGSDTLYAKFGIYSGRMNIANDGLGFAVKSKKIVAHYWNIIPPTTTDLSGFIANPPAIY